MPQHLLHHEQNKRQQLAEHLKTLTDLDISRKYTDRFLLNSFTINKLPQSIDNIGCEHHYSAAKSQNASCIFRVSF